MGLRVAIVGGGIGGLALAQGLRRGGVAVEVFERDAGLAARRQGYRIHLDGRAAKALHECLPPQLYELFRHTLATPGTALTVLDERLNVRHRGATGGGADPRVVEPAALSAPANRQTLREVLATGLEDTITYGRSCTGYDEGPGGVRLHFADGSSAEADVVVGADGVGSAVRRRRLPDARVVDTGARCVYGKTLLTPGTALPEPVRAGFTAVIGGAALGMACALVRFPEPPEVAARRLFPAAAVSPVADYVMWAVTGPAAEFKAGDEELLGAGPGELHRLAAAAIGGWHPELRALVDGAEVDETFLVRVSVSEPAPAWAPGPVTVLGDAIHAMSPAGGSGANTALMDAALLAGALIRADRGEEPLLAAVGGYEARMREYGYAAVAASTQNAGTMWARRHPVLARIAWLLGKGR
ncbi:FAD-dependent oxidoreductase [Dactylosporangium matsuzakiense]|uniref:Monooxygenase n=1 Tax=Dactylosporangium matsuzakiense TaxID=53360 RepID=A0A9W6KT13_9ACTN|nr:FAD-dependent monooxygenase [Dactylosporangium matsuzakiense]UWZ48326.1 FAD-dependent monooxygenase [Dactylosporangium matsuzakiense]GLL07636.1 monooxygenase [Dactylosporangium matsuzakiense]